MTKLNINIQASFKKKNQKVISFPLDKKIIAIPVDEAVYAYYHSQFIREHLTPAQSKKLATLRNLLRAAYLKGKEDAKHS